jgi:branched-chain amino acid transport system substrate-binding protein
MARLRSLALLSVLLLLAACAPKVRLAPETVAPPPDQSLLETARRSLATGEDLAALATLDALVARYPDSRLVAEALLQAGAIRSRLGDMHGAREAFNRVVSDYAASPQAEVAAVALLETYYREGQYQRVIREAPALFGKLASSENLFDAYLLTGDAHRSGDAPVEALGYYGRALELAPERVEAVAERLHQVLPKLDPALLEDLLEKTSDPHLAGFLLFQRGLQQVDGGQYGAAEQTLADFEARFPWHPAAPRAAEIRQALQQRLPAEVAVGCLLPVSGAYRDFGARALKGVQLALSRYAADNPEAEVRLVVKDTASDPQTAIQRVQELGREGVAAIVGPLVTAPEAAAEAQLLGIPIITLTQKQDIVDIGDYVFRNFLTPRMQARALAAYATQTLGVRRFAILYPDETYGKTFMAVFWDEVLAHGGEVTGLEAYPPEMTDFAEPIKRLTGRFHHFPAGLRTPAPATAAGDGGDGEEPAPIVDFDAVFIPDSAATAGLIVPQLAFHDIQQVYLLGTNLWHSPHLVEIAARYVQGAFLTDGFFAESSSPEVSQFVNDFQATFDSPPAFIEAIAYDSAMLVFQTAGAPVIGLQGGLKERLASLEGFRGVTGLTAFEANGEARKTAWLLTIRGYRFEELGYP